MRCGMCGNENAETNYYCGMCGGALVRKSQTAAQGGAPKPVSSPTGARQNSVSQPTRAPEQAARQAATTRQEAPIEAARNGVLQAELHPRESQVPAITGPSFLGLSVPVTRRVESPNEGFGHASQHVSQPDPLRTSGSVDYLLEDEEEPKRGWGKLIALVMALALAGGFGYLRWKQGGFDWVFADRKSAGGEQVSGAPGSADATGTATPGAPATGSAAPATPSAQMPATAGNDSGSQATAATPASAPASNLASPPAKAPNEAESSAQPASPQSGAAANSPTASGAQPAESASSAPAVPTPAAPARAPAAQTENSDSDADTPAAEEPAISKKHLQPKPTPAKPVDAVAEAERYLYGNGVRQDCERGMRLLKPAAAQSNARAMISLGAAYSTGTCTPRDLPTAYRWFALALHKEPDNLPLQNDLQKLWVQMTQPERQLAIKLSQ